MQSDPDSPARRSVLLRRERETLLTLLAEAGTTLAGSLDYQATLEQVARMAVPHLADLCLVDVLDDDRTIRRVAAAHREPEKEALLRELQERFPPDWDSPAPAARVLRTGRPELLREVSERAAKEHTRGEEHLALIRALGIHSNMAVPLVTRERVLGAITFGRVEGSPRFRRHDLRVAQAIAARAALAIDNARLQEHAVRQAEAMRQQQEQARAVFLHTSDAILIADDQMQYVDANPAACELLHLSREEILARRVVDFAPAGAEREVAAAWDRFLREGSQQGEMTLRLPDGDTRSVEFRARAHFQPGRHLSLLNDIGERRRAQEAHQALYQAAQQEIEERKALERRLRASEAEFRSLVEQSPLSIQVLAPDGTTVQVNPAWEHLWGATLEHLHAAGYNMLQDQQLLEKGLMPYIRRAFAGEPAIIPPVEYDRAETLPHLVADPQPSRWVRANIYPVHDEAGALQKVVLVHEDYTDRKLLEDELQEQLEALAEADRRKDAFLAMLGHELRNPLSAVSNALHVLGMAAPGTPAFTRAMEAAVRQVRHQSRIIEDLLDVSRIAQGKIELRRERLDLARLARETAEDHRPALERAGLALTLSLAERAVPVIGDRTRLTQVLENLLENARKFTPAGGSVAVEVKVEGQRVILRVRDTGVGVDAETFQYLFEPFTQADRSLARSPGGLGLGLSLVRGLTELHGGEVAARSEGAGRGAEFVVSLPLVTEPAILENPGQAWGAGPGQLRVLVVEDNLDAAETLRDVLELLGYVVEVAHTGPAGVEKALAFRPEVVLCDIGLPGISGYEVATTLRGRPETADARMVAITGYGSTADAARSREAGFDLHLTKPVAPEDLRQALAAPPPP